MGSVGISDGSPSITTYVYGLIILGYVVLYTGIVLLAGVKYAFNKEDRQMKIISGTVATFIGSCVFSILLYKAVWFIFNEPKPDATERVFSIVMIFIGAMVCLFSCLQNLKNTDYYAEQTTAARILGLGGTILFLILAMLTILSL